MARVGKIISGGQTGADRAALDVAIDLNIAHNGWCPKGRRAEDGRIDRKYNLRETTSPAYLVRTERNVCDSDATLVFFHKHLTGGSAATIALARRHEKPFLPLDIAKFANERQVADKIRKWLEKLPIQPRLDDKRKKYENTAITMNVAGPRESTSPGIHSSVYRILEALLTDECQPRRE
jgi:hypothetical protein